MRARKLLVGLAVVFFGAAATASKAESGGVGPVDGGAVTLGCAALEGASVIEFFFFIFDRDAMAACRDLEGARLTGIWDDDWYGHPGNSPMR